MENDTRKLRRVVSLEADVAKWKVTTRNVWRVERPKVANATVTFVEVIRSNHQPSSEVGDVLAMLLRTKLDSDEVFGRCKDLQREKHDLADNVESTATEG